MNVKLVTRWVRRCGALLLAASVFLSFTMRVSAAPTGEAPPKRIEVSLSQQKLVAWVGDKQVFQFAVTTGQAGEETLLGQYEVLDKEADAYSEGWLLDIPFWLGIYKFGDYENGFHALPSDDAGNVYWADALGKYPASHGCIVLSSEDAEKLFYWASVGTTVDIHD
jgi:lipoprotein-anchoring transpeptidase ErfK/SrfK